MFDWLLHTSSVSMCTQELRCVHIYKVTVIHQTSTLFTEEKAIPGAVCTLSITALYLMKRLSGREGRLYA